MKFTKLKKLKKYKTLMFQVLSFVGIYALSITIISISRMPQVAFSGDTVSQIFNFSRGLTIATNAVAGLFSAIVVAMYHKITHT